MLLLFNRITEIRLLEFLFLCYAVRTTSVSGFGMLSITIFITQRSTNVPSLLNIHPVSHDAPSNCNYSHKDIIWKLGPPKEATPWTKATWKFEAYQVSSFPNFKNEPILIPRQSAMLQALLRNSTSKKALARFGITTESGPSCREMEETIQDLEKLTELDVNEVQNGVAAIKYMFVEPEHRRRMLGKLALEVISQIHAWQNCRYTVLIADDDGSGKLIQWYESNGFTRAPKLDRVFGCIPEKFQDDNSPTTATQLGFAMIAPTRSALLDKYNSSNTNDIYIHCS